MKRIALAFAVWSVIRSTAPRIGYHCEQLPSNMESTILNSTEDACEDMAYALNGAHQQRKKENPYEGITREQLIDLLKDKDFITEGQNEKRH